MSRFWFKQGALNSLEHFLTRFLDAGLSLFLIWIFNPALFGKIAFAQAIVAPLLLGFISPETVLYRDYKSWRDQRTLKWSLSVLNRFSLFKVVLAGTVSAGIGWANQDFEIFWALIWSFSLTLTPQVMGPAKEFLRIELRMVEINFLTLLQKGVLVLLTATSVLIFRQNLAALALIGGVGHMLLSGAASVVIGERWRSKIEPEPVRPQLSSFEFLKETILGFSAWNHINGTIHGWVQTLSILALGWGGVTDATIGIFAAILKFSNFAIMLPTALGQLFSIWLGRQENRPELRIFEFGRLVKFSIGSFVIGLIQGGVLFIIAPWFFDFFSRGRWDDAYHAQIITWAAWFLAGNALLAPVFIMTTWCNLRFPNKWLTFYVYLPLVGLALVFFGLSVKLYGIQLVAQTHFGVQALYCLLCVASTWNRRVDVLRKLR